MSDRPELRGALWEVVLLHLLERAGYRTVEAGQEGTRGSAEKLTVRGRGTWHECDGLAALDHTPAFLYPLRLIVEAKCYEGSRVPVSVVRSMLGVLRDINEDYYSVRPPGSDEVRLPRHDYVGVICSSTGYTSEAQRFAAAHRIFLLDYRRVPLMEPIIDALSGGADALLQGDAFTGLREARAQFARRLRLRGGADDLWERPEWQFVARVSEGLDEIGGSCFGMLQGQFPLHLLSPGPLPEDWFDGRDELECRARRLGDGRWRFTPSAPDDELAPLEVQFRLPSEVQRLVHATRSPDERADRQQRRRWTIHLSGLIGDVRRNVVLRLGDEWLRRDLPPEA